MFIFVIEKAFSRRECMAAFLKGEMPGMSLMNIVNASLSSLRYNLPVWDTRRWERAIEEPL